VRECLPPYFAARILLVKKGHKNKLAGTSGNLSTLDGSASSALLRRQKRPQAGGGLGSLLRPLRRPAEYSSHGLYAGEGNPMASNPLVFFAGVGTTFVLLTAGFGSGLVLTKAAFDDKPTPSPDSRTPPAVRVILPAYGEAVTTVNSAPAQPHTDAPPLSIEAEPARETSIPAAKVSLTHQRTGERNLKAERRRQAERKARRVAAARARQEMNKVQGPQQPGIMAFGGDGHFFGN
jgi:hypothetical protein